MEVLLWCTDCDSRLGDTGVDLVEVERVTVGVIE